MKMITRTGTQEIAYITGPESPIVLNDWFFVVLMLIHRDHSDIVMDLN